MKAIFPVICFAFFIFSLALVFKDTDKQNNIKKCEQSLVLQELKKDGTIVISDTLKYSLKQLVSRSKDVIYIDSIDVPCVHCGTINRAYIMLKYK